MRFLFIHQNFPGQYLHIAKHLAAAGHQVVALAQRDNAVPPGVTRLLYQPQRQPAAQTHHYLRGAEQGVLNGQAVLRMCLGLQEQGFRPDIVIGHNGWGEILFVKEVWPDVPVLGYFEFFYHLHGADSGFDPEYPLTLDDGPRLRIKNTVNLLGLDVADWGQVPTRWQRSVHPALYQPRLSVIHEGVDTQALKPDPLAAATLPDGTLLKAGDEIITYVARNLEPYRGFHVFMRALPEILRRRPRAQVLVIGSDGVSYGKRLSDGQTYLTMMQAEVGERLDHSRVHIIGALPYEQYQRALQISAVHIYLTYPFVLSWSMLEAMSSGCLVVGSATAPVMEVIEHGVNGLLVDFFDQKALADRIDEVLDHPSRLAPLRMAARRTVVERYDLHSVCLPQHLELVATLVEGKTPA
jgi:glycosyltransferase involved in cell wall biosynthesis